MVRRVVPDNSLPLDPELEDEMERLAAPGEGDDALRADAMMQELLLVLDDILPSYPAPPGWSVTWLSTTNERDTIAMRERWGYVPYRVSDLPAGHPVSDADPHSTSQTQDGLIRVREMILYKIPTERRHMILRIFHHDRPNQLAEALDPRRNPLLTELRDRKGTPLVHNAEIDTSNITAPRAAPRHFS